MPAIKEKIRSTYIGDMKNLYNDKSFIRIFCYDENAFEEIARQNPAMNLNGYIEELEVSGFDYWDQDV